jgi:hypothetical protein
MHLYLDVHPETGAVKINWPGLERVDQRRVSARLKKLLPQVKVRQRRRSAMATVMLRDTLLRAHALTAEAARDKLVARLVSHLEAEESYLDLGEMEETCALDVAEAGPQTLVRVGRLLNLTLERARQIRDVALKNVANALQARDARLARMRPRDSYGPEDDGEDPEEDEGETDPG